MTNTADKQLKVSYRALRDLQRILDEAGSRRDMMVPVALHDQVASELSVVNVHFPGLLPPQQKILIRDGYAELAGLRSVVGSALARVSTALEETTVSPIAPGREFLFVEDARLRAIIERDYLEISRASVTSCWKAAIVLSGGLIEAVLLDLLQKHAEPARRASAAPRESDLSKWTLEQLIDVSVELHLVSSGAAKLSHPIRSYRNLIHPGNELRSKLVFGEEEARIAVEVLHIVHRDLLGSVKPSSRAS